MQLKELNAAKGSISKLLVAERVPARVCYRATKFSKKVMAELTALEEQRMALVEKYGVLNQTQESPELEMFRNDFKQLLEEEVELPDIVIALGDIENAGLTMLDFANLDFMIQESDPTERK
jgi:hypothetical protein